VRRKLRRNRIIPTGREALWDIDLADVSIFTEYNDGIKYLLIIIYVLLNLYVLNFSGGN
jgi:hypothetical protein